MLFMPDGEVSIEIEDLARALADTAFERDQNNTFARDVFEALGARGVYALALERDVASLEQLCALLYHLALDAKDLGFVASLCAHLCAIFTLRDFGKEQREPLLDAMVRGESLGAIANSEPDAGTDLMGLRTRAIASDGKVTLDGTKWSITNVSEAEVLLVSAINHDQSSEERGQVEHHIVEANRDGVLASRVEDLIGLRTSITGNLTLSEVCLEQTSLLGNSGDGLTIFGHQFDHERLLTATLYLAALDTALERGVKRGLEREQFGRPIIENQYIQQVLVDARMARELLAAQLHLVSSQWNDPPATTRGSLSILKLHGLDSATRACRDVLGILGGRGLRQDEPLTRMLRDLLGLAMLGGTRELHKMILHRNTLRTLTRQREAKE